MILDLPRRAAVRTGRVLRFLGYFAGRLVLANLVVAREVLSPRSRLCPAVVRVPLRSGTDTEIVLVGLCVGLTPGTLAVAVRRDPPVLYVHGMHADDPQEFRRGLGELEEKLLLALRPVGPGRHATGSRPGAGGMDRR